MNIVGVANAYVKVGADLYIDVGVDSELLLLRWCQVSLSSTIILLACLLAC